MTETEKAPFDELPPSGNVDDFVNKIWYTRAENLLAALPDKSIDLILTDFPYGITQADYDVKQALPDYTAIGVQMFRVIKPNGAVISTAAQPFTSKLVMFWERYFRYEWIWRKTRKTNFLNAKKMPLTAHESILVFGHKLPKYFPQMAEGEIHKRGKGGHRGTALYGKFENYGEISKVFYPDSVLEFPHDPELTSSKGSSLHPNAKPLELWQYLINTYSLQRDIILDPFSGGGVTAIAATNLDRRFICCDSHLPYALNSRERLARHDPFVSSPLSNGKKQLSLFSDIDPASE